MRILTLSSLFPQPAHPDHGRFVSSRVRELARLAQVTVVAPIPLIEPHSSRPFSPPPLSPVPDSVRGLDVRYVRWLNPPGLASLAPAALTWSLASVVADLHRQQRFDLIDAEFGFPDGPVAQRLALRLGIPFTVTLRGSEVEHAAIPSRRRALAAAFRSASAVVALSERLKDFAISAGAPVARTHVIPNGIDSSLYYPRDRSALRAALRFEPNAFHVLTAGHLIELKGHHLAVEAIARSAPALRLCIAGGPGSRASFEPRIRELIDALGLRDRVTLAGHLPPARLAEFMCASDLYCLASSREGWPNTVQESLACGTPVAAFDVGAIPEMLPSEEFGSIVRTRTPEALAAAFAQCHSRNWDRARIAAWGARRSWTAVGAEVIAIFQAALKDSPSRR